MAKKDITIKMEVVPSVLSADELNMGMEDLDSSDIIVPKLLLMQGLSQMVAGGEAQQGQIVDSLRKKVLGGITNVKTKECKPVEVIPLRAFKTWLQFEKQGGQWVYQSTTPFSMENSSLVREEIVNGIEVRRDLCLNYYVLLPSEVADNQALPYVVSFRRMSMRAGKAIATIAKHSQACGVRHPIAAKHIILNVVQMEKDGHSFWTFDATEGGISSDKERAKAEEWYNIFKMAKANVKIDDSDLREPLKAEVAEAEVEY